MVSFLTFDLSVSDSKYEWFPYGTRRYLEEENNLLIKEHLFKRCPYVPLNVNISLNLLKCSPILLARACSSSTVWPQAALISFHSTGTLGSRPRRKLLIVPNWPLCLNRYILSQSINIRLVFSLKI